MAGTFPLRSREIKTANGRSGAGEGLEEFQEKRTAALEIVDGDEFISGMRLVDRAGADGYGRAAFGGKDGGVAKPRRADGARAEGSEDLDERVRGVGPKRFGAAKRDFEAGHALLEKRGNEGRIDAGDEAHID